MSDAFSPSTDAAKAAIGSSTPIVTNAHPTGAHGAKVSLNEVAARILRGRNDPRVNGWAGRALTHKAGCPFIPTGNHNKCNCGGGYNRTSTKDQGQAVLDALKAQTQYVQDPVNTEMMKQPAQTLCLDEQGLCMPAGDCFPKGTLLLRDDFTFVPIENIKIGERIWGRDKWTRVENKWFKGVLPIDVIYLNNGSQVPLTENHKVYRAVCDRHANRVTTAACACPIDERRIERVAVKELNEDDVIIQPTKLPFGSEEMDPDRAYVEGLYVSDGWSEDYRFSISGRDGQPKEAQKHEVKAICDRLGVDTYWHAKYIRVNDSEWTLRLQEMGTHAPEKHLLSINYNEATAAQTLRGVMADSGKNTNGNGRTFTTTSHELAIQVRVLQRMFGKSCGITYIVDHGGLGKNPIWRLFIRDTEPMANGKTRREKLLRVKEVEHVVDERPCYDIETEDHYVYLPEHDVTVSNCDDRCITYGSAMMSLGVPVKVVGQCFDNGKVPTHVIVAIQDTKNGEWYRVDPSSKYDVGNYFPAKSEDWIDPLDMSSQTTGDFVGVGHHDNTPSDFVGVGQSPAHRPLVPDVNGNDIQNLAFPYFEHFYPVHQLHDPVGVGQTATTDANIVQQLQTAVYTLQTARDNLKASLAEITSARSLVGSPFDPEPSYAITDLSNFPTDGSWTQSMAQVCDQIMTVSDTLIAAGQQALSGARQILLYANMPDVFVSSLSTDQWSIKAVLQTINDTIYGFFDPNGNVLGGFSAASGAAIGHDQIVQEVTQAEHASAGVHGVVGVGQDPITLLGTAVIAGATVYYIYSKYCALAETKAKEATNQAMLKCVTTILPNGQPACTPEQVIAMQAALSKARVDEENARAAANKDDPFTNFFSQLVTGVKWLVVGGVIVGIGVIAFPVIEEGVAGLTDTMRAKRAARLSTPPESR